MFNCPFCGADYSDDGLDNGRCRQCSAMVAWSTVTNLEPVTPAAAAVEAAVDDGQTPPDSEPRSKAMEQTDNGAISETMRRGSDTGKSDTGKSDTGRSDTGRSDADAASASNPDLKSTDAASPPEVAKTLAIEVTPHVSEEVANADTSQIERQWGGTISVGAKVSNTLKSATEQEDDEAVDIGSTPGNLLIRSRSFRPIGDGRPSDYELINVVGEGGAGIVYAARQASIDRVVAIKTLKPETEQVAEERRKFLTEAVITGELEHPNIVPIYDLGASKGTFFYSMKRVQGTPWSDVIRKNPLSENLEILMRTADAVAFSHARGVVHRDLKPENVMLGGYGEVLLMDWGIALATPEFAKANNISDVVGLCGTPGYMAPEMAVGPVEKITKASDVYLLGAILFEILTGKMPHNADTIMKCLYAVANNEIQPTEVRGELMDIAMKAMSTQPGDRHASVLEFQAALREYESHRESTHLAEQANRDLSCAVETRDYDDFSRAVYGFQQAVAMWEHNTLARESLVHAKHGYATAALQKGDFDLGLSLLDDRPEYADVRKQLLNGKRLRASRQQAIRNLYRVAGLLLIAIFGGGAVAMVWIANAKNDAVAARDAAKSSEQVARQKTLAAEKASALATQREAEAKAAGVKAEKAAEAARESAEVARKSEDDAKKSAADALRERAAAEASLRTAQAASYVSEISLAASNIESNAFDDAYKLLAAQRGSRSDLIDWEWRRLMYLCLGAESPADPTAAVKTIDGGQVLAGVALFDGFKKVAFGGVKGKISVWDLEQGNELLAFDHGAGVNGIAVSEDGSLLASAGADGLIKVWRLADVTAPPLVLDGHSRPVHCVAFPKTAGRPAVLASSSADRSVRLWDLNSGAARHTIVGHTGDVWSIDFSRDGQRIVSASQDQTVRVWSADTGAELQRFREHGEPVFCAQFSPDGRFVASGGYDKRILVWAADSFQPVTQSLVSEVKRRLQSDDDDAAATRTPFRAAVGHAASVRCVRFDETGRRLISGSQDNTIKLWDLAGDRGLPLLKTLRGHGGWVKDCQISADGKTIASAAFDGKVKLWDIDRVEEVRVFGGHERPVSTAVFSPDGAEVAVALDDGTARVFDARSKQQLAVLQEGHEFLTTRAVFLPDGQRLLTVAGDDTVRLWDAQRGVQLWEAEGTGRRGLLALAPNGSLFATGSSDGKSAQIFSTADGKLIRRLLPPSADDDPLSPQAAVADVTALAFSRDSSLLASGNAFGAVSLWSVSGDSPPRRLTGHTEPVTSAVFVPHTNLLMTSSLDQSVAFWDIERMEESDRKRLLHRDTVSFATVSDDGKYAITLGSDGKGGQQLNYWDLATSQRLRSHPTDKELDAPSDRSDGEVINSVAFAPDQRSAVVATFLKRTSRYQLRTWDLESGEYKSLRDSKVQPGLVFSASFPGADEKELLTVGGNAARSWLTSEGREKMNYRPHGQVASIRYSPDGQRLITSSSDYSAKIWIRDPASSEGWRPEQKLFGLHSAGLKCAEFHPDASVKMLLTADVSGLLVVWRQSPDGSQWDALHNLRRPPGDGPNGGSPAAIHQAAFAPNGETIAAASADGAITIWNTQTGQLRRTIQASPSELLCLAFSPDSRLVLAGGSDNAASLWDAGTGDCLMSLEGHSAPVSAVAVSPDGIRALTGSQDNTIKVWDISSTLPQPSPAREIGEDGEAASSPEIVTDGAGDADGAGEDETGGAVAAGDAGDAGDAVGAKGGVKAATELLTLRRHEREVTSAHFSSTGQYVLSSSRDGRTILWLATQAETPETPAAPETPVSPAGP